MPRNTNKAIKNNCRPSWCNSARAVATAIIVIAATTLGMTGLAEAHSTGRQNLPNTEFGPIQQIDAGLLNVGYVEAGPANGTAVILLHGWPYDIHSYIDVAPILASAGYRVIVPYLRGYGTTTFLSNKTPRSGQQALTALDVIALMDALKIKKGIFGGFDWGSREVTIIAALWPERCK